MLDTFSIWASITGIACSEVQRVLVLVKLYCRRWHTWFLGGRGGGGGGGGEGR